LTGLGGLTGTGGPQPLLAANDITGGTSVPSLGNFGGGGGLGNQAGVTREGKTIHLKLNQV